jgi:hypothetical protein
VIILGREYCVNKKREEAGNDVFGDWEEQCGPLFIGKTNVNDTGDRFLRSSQGTWSFALNAVVGGPMQVTEVIQFTFLRSFCC